MMDNYNMSWYLQAESKRIGKEVKECRRSPFPTWLRWMGQFNSPTQPTSKQKQAKGVKEKLHSFPPSSKPN